MNGTDEMLTTLEVIEFERTGEIISHWCARTIAAGYNEWGPAAAFVATGQLSAPNKRERGETAEEAVESVMAGVLKGFGEDVKERYRGELDALRAYLKWRAESDFCGPVNGWSMLGGGN